jgi:Mg2+ and Co2+ transporter CorA
MKYKQSVIRLLDKVDNKTQVINFAISRNESRERILELLGQLQEELRQAKSYVEQEYDELR